jgi:hypothetical protein
VPATTLPDGAGVEGQGALARYGARLHATCRRGRTIDLSIGQSIHTRGIHTRSIHTLSTGQQAIESSTSPGMHVLGTAPLQQ